MANDPNTGPADRVDVRHLHRVEAELRHALEIVRRQGDRLHDAQREVLALRVRIGQADQDEQRQARELDRVQRGIQARDEAARGASARRLVRQHDHWIGRLSRRLDQLNRTMDVVWRSEAPASARRQAAARLLRHPRAVSHIATIADSGLFDAAYFTRTYGVDAGPLPIVSYVLDTQQAHRRPNPLFDPVWYRARYPDAAASPLPTLSHYLQASARELRDPHPLFHAARYARSATNGIGAPLTPLGHYLLFGADTSLSPHALFDPAFYLRTYPDVAAAGVNPLAHLLEYGTRDRRRGHPLVDPHFYFAQYPDAAKTGDDALVDFCARGAAQGRSPHALFDTAYYLSSNPEVRVTGANALEHFLETGWRDGRRPNPFFDPRYYLARYSDVRASGVNPLVHFVEHGWRQLRDPSAEFSTTEYLARYSDVAHGGGDALSHYLWHGRKEGRAIHPAPSVPVDQDHSSLNIVTLPDSGIPVRLTAIDRNPARVPTRTVIVATHVVPTPPRAGNAYRLLRLMTWLKHNGYRTILVLAPLENEREGLDIDAIAGELGDTIVVSRDGAIDHVLEDGRELIASLDGRTVHRRPGMDTGGAWQGVDDSYCHDAMVEVVLHLQAALHPCALLVQYIWMSRLLELADRRTFKILDSIDAYSTKAAKVGDFGIGDHFIDEREEAIRLQRADLVLAIQSDERDDLARIVPHRRVITVGVDFDPMAMPAPLPANPVIGYLGSNNPMNVQGLRDFLRFAWPRILTRVPNAELMVAGDAGAALAAPWPNVRRVGPVTNVGGFYSAARLIINPANAGTGLKIKGLEALCHGRPLVTWPAGVEGFGPLARFARLARDWFEFAEQVCAVLADQAPAAFSGADWRLIRECTDTNRVYADLAAELDAFFDNRPVPQAARSVPVRSAR